MDTGDSKIDTLMASFLNDLYRKGLAEFAYFNRLDLSGLIDFEVNTIDPPATN